MEPIRVSAPQTRDGILAGDIQMRRIVGLGICLVIGIAVSASCGGRSVLDPDDINTDGLGAADDPNSLKFMVTTMLLHPWTITKAVVRTIWLRLTPRK